MYRVIFFKLTFPSETFLINEKLLVIYYIYIFRITAVRRFKLHHLLHGTFLRCNRSEWKCATMQQRVVHLWPLYCWKKHVQAAAAFCRELSSYIPVSASSARQNKLLIPSMELRRKCVFGYVSILYINRLFNFWSRGEKHSLLRVENWKILRERDGSCVCQDINV